jgi:hypothetical protein
MTSVRNLLFGAAAAVCLMAASAPASAAACFSEPVFTALGNTFTCTLGANVVTITGPGGGITRLNEGDGWAGEFVHGSPLYFDNGTPGPVTALFSIPIPLSVNSLLLSAQPDLVGPYTATLSAYYLGSFVGSTSYSGDNELGPEGTIPTFDFSVFGGALVDELVYSTTDDGSGFAVGSNIPSVPEPATWTLMLVVLGGLGGLARARRQAAIAAV